MDEAIERLRRRIAVARGERPPDLVVVGARIADVFTGRLLEADIAIAEGAIAGLGAYRGPEVLDAGGAIVAPGLIEAHMHLESTMLSPHSFSEAAVPRGTTTVIMDPHEIANVGGAPMVRALLAATRGLPLDFFAMASSSVPSSAMETTGGSLSQADVAALLAEPGVLGLAEVMDFPGLLRGDPGVLGKVAAAGGRPVDGHAPALRGRELDAYCGAGIGSDHEAVEPAEALERLARGLVLFIRESSVAHNLERLLPAIPPAAHRRCCLVTDDLLPQDLVQLGHLDHLLRKAVRLGVDPMEALRMVTLNPAEYFGLRERGAVAPGRLADLVLFEDLRDFAVRQVLKGGRVVAAEGRLRVALPAHEPLASLRGTVHLPEVRADDLAVPAGRGRCRAIALLPDSILTEALWVTPALRDGRVVADPGRDLLLVAVLERYRGTGRRGVGLLSGLGLGAGAVASSVGHDAHNVIVAGTDEAEMAAAANRVAAMGGGLAVVRGGRPAAELALPLGGLMSPAAAAEVADAMTKVDAAARALGSPLEHPFIALSFVPLAVIPKLKLTDHGLVDVEAGRIVPLFEE